MRARTRVLSLVLAMVLICTMYMPTSVIAAETGSTEPEVTNYDDFFYNLKVLEGYAEQFASGASNTKKYTTQTLVVNFIRTGVERYRTVYWNGLAGEEITAFVEFVAAKDAENNTTATALRNIVTDNFRLPNGNHVDFGHMFGTLNIIVASPSVDSHDVGGWSGDICDLLLYSRDKGDVPEGTVDEMAAFILEKCFGVDADNAFGWDDFYGDMDAFYLGTEWLEKGGDLSDLMDVYFTEELTNVERSAYFLNNRFEGLKSHEDVRNAVYNAYVNNTAIELLEGSDDRNLTNVDPDLRKAACYAFADYVFSLGEAYLEDDEGGSGEGGEGEGGSGEGGEGEGGSGEGGEGGSGEGGDEGDEEETKNPYYSDYIINDSILAPGISQSIRYAKTADGKQIVYYVATVDVTRDDVTIMANYKDADPSKGWGMQTVLDQAAALKEKYSDPKSDNYIPNFNPIVATNADGYNMSTGEPGGLLVMDGKEWKGVDGDGFFAILKDGTAKIGTYADYATYKNQIQEAVGGFGAVLVKDGKICVAHSDTYYRDRASRTAIGITAEGKVVMMVMDGRQEPVSCGGSMQEIAQVMYEAGCVEAINLDGGGSTTYTSKPEGSDELQLVNRPSDGFQRNVSTSLVAVSTGTPSYALDHVNISFEYDYLTPNTSIEATVVGVSGSGNAAEIPADAIWKVSDNTMGSMTSDGVFTAGKDTGSVTVSLVQGDKVLGEKTVYIVIPDALTAESATLSVVYDQMTTLPLIATFEGNRVAVKPSDFYIALQYSNAGRVEGFDFLVYRESEYRSLIAGAQLLLNPAAYVLVTVNCFREDEAIFDYDNATGGNRQFAWLREVSNSTTNDTGDYFYVEDPAKPMDITYTFGLDMEAVSIPEEFSDILYMLGDTGESTPSAWGYLLKFAERISVLTTVTVVAQFDKDLDINYENLTFVNDFFQLKSKSFDKETNTLTIVCNWIDQTQAVDAADANPTCILSGITATPKDGAWSANETLDITNTGNISYDIYARFSSLYTFASDPANQQKYGLYAYSSNEVLYNGGPEQGGHFASTYASFTDSFTLNKANMNGWYTFGDLTYYYKDHAPLTGIQLLPGYEDPTNEYFYRFNSDGSCEGLVTGLIEYNGALYYAIDGVRQKGWMTVNTDAGPQHYFFNTSSYQALNGVWPIGDATYTFENNILVRGDLVKTANGKLKYWWAGKLAAKAWHTIDGNTYFFESNQYAVSGFYGSGVIDVYVFDENCVWLKDYTGLYEANGQTYYVENGMRIYEPGLQKIDDSYYYFRWYDSSVQADNAQYKYGVMVKNGSAYVSSVDSHGIIPSGTYSFDAEGRLIFPDGVTPNKFTITWDVAGNKTTQQLEYGDMPSFTGSTDKAASGCSVFEFAGWDKEITSVKGTVTYTALYNETKNHKNVVIDAYKAATCTSSGLTEGSHCTACNEQVVEQKFIAPLNHKDADRDHVCDREGCDVRMGGDCASNPGRHECAYCGELISECVDDDKNHKCDICQTYMGVHVDGDDADHLCDYGCGDTMTRCADGNKDHKCDSCGAVLSAKITGTVKSTGSETAPIYVRLYRKGWNDYSYQVTVYGNDTTFEFGFPNNAVTLRDDAYNLVVVKEGSERYETTVLVNKMEVSVGAISLNCDHSYTNKPSDILEGDAEYNCEGDNIYYVACDNCGIVNPDKTVNVPGTGHQYNEKPYYDNPVVKCDCTNDGKYYVQCDNCDNHTEEKIVVITAPGHNYVDTGVKSSDATCTTPQQNVAECTNENCGGTTLVSVGSVNPDNHANDEVIYKNVTAATHDVCHACCGALVETAEHIYDADHKCVCGMIEVQVETGNIDTTKFEKFEKVGNTVTMKYEEAACKVGYLDANGNYVVIEATANADGSYSFIAPEGVTEIAVVVKGDANGDGDVSAADLTALARHAAGIEVITSAGAYFAADGDGVTGLSAADLTRLARATAGIENFAW